MTGHYVKQRIFNLTREIDYGFLLPAIQRLPRRWALWAAERRGELAYLMRGAWRRSCLEDLALAFPSWDAARRRLVARGVARTLSHDEVETRWFGCPRGWFDERVETEGLELLQEACSSGQGALLYTAHTGCPGTAICFLGRRGVPLHLVFRPLIDVAGMPRAWYRYGDERIRLLEEACGRGTLYTGRSNYFAMRRALRSGEAVIIALDVMPSISSRSVEVDFLGNRALIPEGPARLYRDTSSRVLYWSTTRSTPKHGLRLLDVTPTLSGCSDLTALTQALVAPMEQEIRRRPEDWMMWGALKEFLVHDPSDSE